MDTPNNDYPFAVPTTTMQRDGGMASRQTEPAMVGAIRTAGKVQQYQLRDAARQTEG